MTGTMRAVVVDRPGPPEVLQIRELPIPHPQPGQVLIRVKASGLNRSELHFRQGLYAAKRQREPEAGPLRPKQVDVEPARVVLVRNARGKNRHVIHVPLDRIGEVKAPPPRPGQVMGQLHDAAWRPCQVAERRRQGFLDAWPVRGQIPPAVGIVHGVILPRIEGTIELKRRTARPLNSPRGRVAILRPRPLPRPTRRAGTR